MDKKGAASFEDYKNSKCLNSGHNLHWQFDQSGSDLNAEKLVLSFKSHNWDPPKKHVHQGVVFNVSFLFIFHEIVRFQLRSIRTSPLSVFFNERAVLSIKMERLYFIKHSNTSKFSVKKHWNNYYMLTVLCANYTVVNSFLFARKPA